MTRMVKATIIRTSGERVEVEVSADNCLQDLKKFMPTIDCFDLVRLRGRKQIMWVDDEGYLKDPRPYINVEATKLYHEVCVPGTTHKILGDVALMAEGDVE